MNRTMKALWLATCAMAFQTPATAQPINVPPVSQPMTPGGLKLDLPTPPSLVQQDVSSTLAALERIARNHPDPAVRKAAAEALKALEPAAQAADTTVGIRDDVKLFGKDAVARANKSLHAFNKSTGFTTAIDVVDGLPADKVNTFKDNKEKWDFVWKWANERVAARGTTGMYLLIFKDGTGYAWQFVTIDQQRFSNADARRVSDAFSAKFQKPDEALAEFVELTCKTVTDNATKPAPKIDVPPPQPMETEKARKLRELKAKQTEYEADVLRCQQDVIYWQGQVASNPKSLSAPIGLQSAKDALSTYQAKLEAVKLEIQFLDRP